MPFFGKTTGLEVEVSSLSTPAFFKNSADDSRCFEVKGIFGRVKNGKREYAPILKSWSDYGESAQVSILSSKKREVATLRNGEFWQEMARNMSGEARKRFLHGEFQGQICNL